MSIKVSTGGSKEFVYSGDTPRSEEHERKVTIGYYEHTINKLKKEHKEEMSNLKDEHKLKIKDKNKVIAYLIGLVVVIIGAFIAYIMYKL